MMLSGRREKCRKAACFLREIFVKSQIVEIAEEKPLNARESK
jgi:hypothetical protein